MIPALCDAISSIVCPRNSIWSILIDVITLTSGMITFVASYLPPIPVSIRQISGCSSSMIHNAIKNIISKKEGWLTPFSTAASTHSFTLLQASLNLSSEISCPFSRIRSFTFTRCGEVNAAVVFPCSFKTASKNAQTDPLPLVPATCTNFRSLCGFPSCSNK